jgi:hypothetical protein
MYPSFSIEKLCDLLTECVCVFHMILTINTNCFLKQLYPNHLCKGDALCLL